MLHVDSTYAPMLTEFTCSKCHAYARTVHRTLCTTYVRDVELEVSLLVDGVSVLPADVGVYIITWVVSVGPFTVQVHAEYIKLH